MPYVNVKITKDGVTTAQKKQIVEEITQTLVSVLGKKPEHIHGKRAFRGRGAGAESWTGDRL